MKRKAWISCVPPSLLASATLALAAGAHAGATKVGDFSLIDHQGAQHQLSRLGGHKAVVVISQANSCSENIEKLHKYKLLKTIWEPQGVKFLMLNSSHEDDLKSIRTVAKTYDVTFPIMNDDAQLVAESLGISKAGEILVLDPKTMQLVYRGPLDKAVPRRRGDDAEAKPVPQPLNESLAKIVAGEHKNMAAVTVPVKNDCDYTFPVKQMHAKAQPDYVKDIAPLLKENCATCHVEGGIGPFPMNSYEMVRGWAPMIREVVMTKRMPPAQVDPEINHFTNANYFEPEKMQTLVHWLDAGAPRGDSKVDPLHSVKAIDTEWQLGEPDMVVELPAYTVPATGVIDYFNHVIDLGFEEDRYVRAVQFIPGDNRVLHHLLAYITSPESGNEVMDEENVRDFLEGYAPGKTDATTFPENTGVFVPKGYNLTMQMHYTSMGKEVKDVTRVGLYFHDKKPEHKFLTKSVSHGGTALELRPGVSEHAMNMHYVFNHDTMLYAMRPHMHYRGKSFKFSVIYPDGRRETLMNVPNYNFAWQPTYRLSEPKFLPAGSRVINDAVFDNSEYNPGNPDPNVTVRGGAQSWDEMFIGYYTYTNLGNEIKADEEQQLTSNQ